MMMLVAKLIALTSDWSTSDIMPRLAVRLRQAAGIQEIHLGRVVAIAGWH
jgi:hypothetical protein